MLMAKMNRTPPVWWRTAGLALVLGLGAVPLLALWTVQHVVKVEPQPPFDQRLAERVAAAVANGTLEPDANGVVVLPSRYASVHVAANSRLYVTHASKGLTLILFPSFEGWDGDVDGYLFCSRPLTQADFVAHKSGTRHAIIPLLHETGARRRFSPGQPPEPIEAELLQRLSTHWCFVDHKG
jgi:hypothetical protein